MFGCIGCRHGAEQGSCAIVRNDMNAEQRFCRERGNHVPVKPLNPDELIPD